MYIKAIIDVWVRGRCTHVRTEVYSIKIIIINNLLTESDQGCTGKYQTEVLLY